MVRDIGETVVSGNRIEWTIKDFLSQASEDTYTYLDSKVFCFKSERLRFELCVNDLERGWFEVTLAHRSPGDLSAYSAHFSMRKRNGEETERSKAEYSTHYSEFKVRHLHWHTLVENKDELLPNGHLTIIYHIQEREQRGNKKSRLDEAAQVSLNKRKRKAAMQTIEDATTSSVTSEFTDGASFRDACKAMYQSGEFCDFDVKVQNRIFRTHKLVLAARSSAFASMLRHDMQEKKTGMVEIDDCDSEKFEAFLNFLYSGNNDVIIPENVLSLFEVANKYDVQNLKAECLRFMMKNLSTELFCDVICLALKHEERELIKHATEYFKLNKKNIFLSEQWQIFVKENSAYVTEFLIKTCD